MAKSDGATVDVAAGAVEAEVFLARQIPAGGSRTSARAARALLHALPGNRLVDHKPLNLEQKGA